MHEKFDAIVNLLLEHEGAQTLIFARTRADVAQMTRRLAEAGFTVDSLSGEMEQRERNRALSAFKRGDLDALVATDVAARGIDVVDISRVIHADAPDDADSYTHRSGRTGRAGKKGKSSVLVSPGALPRASMLLRRAGVTFSVAKIPDADTIRNREDDKLLRELTSNEGENEAFAKPDARARAIAATLVADDGAEEAIARLVMSVRGKRPEPREVSSVEMRGNDRAAMQPRDSRDAPPPRARREHDPDARFVSYRVSWGQVHGAEVRRVLAMVCRRGGIGSESVGSIRVAPTYSIVDVAENVAPLFAEKASAPDPRDPRITITPSHDESAARSRGDRDERPREFHGARSRDDRPRRDGPPNRDDRPHRDGPRHRDDRPARPREDAQRAEFNAPRREAFNAPRNRDEGAPPPREDAPPRPRDESATRPRDGGHSRPRPAHARGDARPHFDSRPNTNRPEKKPHRKGPRPGASSREPAEAPRDTPRVPPPARSRPSATGPASHPRIPAATHSKPKPKK